MKKAIAIAALGIAAPEQVQSFEFDWKKFKIQATDSFKSLQIGKYKFSHEDDLMSKEEYQFMDFIAQFGRQYPTKSEYYERLGIFKERMTRFNEWNSQPGQTSFMGITPYTDWTKEELAKLRGYKKLPLPNDHQVKHAVFPDKIDEGVDWRSKGGVTGVKD